MGHFFYMVRCTPGNFESKYQTQKFVHENPFKAKKNALEYLQETIKKAIDNHDVYITDEIENYATKLFGKNIHLNRSVYALKYNEVLTENNLLDFETILGSKITYPNQFLSKISMDFFDGRRLNEIFTLQNSSQTNTIHHLKQEAEVFNNFKNEPFINWTNEEREILKAIPIISPENLYINKMLIKKYEKNFSDTNFKDKAVISIFSFAEFEKNVLAFHNTKNGFVFLKIQDSESLFLYDTLKEFFKNMHPQINITGKDVIKIEDYQVFHIIKGRKILKSFDGKYYFRGIDEVFELNHETSVKDLIKNRKSDYQDIKQILELL